MVHDIGYTVIAYAELAAVVLFITSLIVGVWY
jgi:hypothetical protein